jgi:hypothetical protein
VEPSYWSYLFAIVNFAACSMRFVPSKAWVSGEEQLTVGICLLQPDNSKLAKHKSKMGLISIIITFTVGS